MRFELPESRFYSHFHHCNAATTFLLSLLLSKVSVIACSSERRERERERKVHRGACDIVQESSYYYFYGRSSSCPPFVQHSNHSNIFNSF